VSILGPGPGLLTVSGNHASRVFNITGTNVTISGLTIANGQSAENGAGINAAGSPGSVLTISDCVVNNNSTTASGGGIFNNAGVTMTVSYCTISGNNGNGNGGGIYNQNGMLTIVASTLNGNLAGFGGGIANDGGSGGNATMTLNVSTISSNSAYGGGGGILNWGQSGSATLTVNASTFSGNSAGGSGGGGIFNNNYAGTGKVEIADTIFNAGSAGANIYNYSGPVKSDGYNLSSDGAGGFLTATGDQINTDPKLGRLQNNGGPTMTHALLPGSPAINRGKANAVTNLVSSTDQRGVPRPFIAPGYTNAPGGDGSDIGAFEGRYLLVTSTGDSGPGTLRAALAAADFVAATNLFGAITLTSGELEASNSVTILGPGPGLLTVSGNNASRVCNVTGPNVAISGLTIANGSSTNSGAGINAAGGPGSVVAIADCVVTNNTSTGAGADGAGIYNGAGVRMTVSNCVIAGNRASGAWGGGIMNSGGWGQTATLTVNASTISRNSAASGGGICNEGGWGRSATLLTVNASTISSNSADNSGGGIFNDGESSGGNASLTVSNSTLYGNSAAAWGGGLYNLGQSSGNASVTFSRSTLAGNWAGDRGGGIDNDGYAQGRATVALNLSTLSGNATANWGGGIYNDGYNANNAAVTINASTISSNSADNSGVGIYNDGENNGNATVLIGDTILNAGLGTNIYNVAGTVASAGYNLSTDNGGGFLTNTCDQIGTNPLLAPLGNYGGPTPTMPPLPGSPAIDNGSDSVTNTFATDQRGSGFPRLSGLHVDIGAVESAYAPAAPLVVSQPATGATPTAATLNATVTPNGAVTAYYFQYGLTTNYGIVTATNTLNAGATAVNANLTGLPPATVYHFRAVATNSLGSTFGDDLTFRTGGLTNLVTNTNDSGPGSLRAAVANSIVGDSIIFATNLFGQTILLTNGQITLNRNLTIDASALPNGISINGNNASRVFEVSNATVVLNSLTITNGIDTGGGNAGGGGILSYGTLTLNNCTLAGNSANQPGYGGGGILSYGTLTLNNCTVSGNSAHVGGGITSYSGTLTINQSTLWGNSATALGGGIMNDGEIGGSATLRINQSTLWGNSANEGGGIMNYYGTLTINQSTLSGNSATNFIYSDGGGICNYFGPLALYRSIVAGNVPDNLIPAGTTTSTGVNLTSGDPLLAPLGNYGGPTPTMPPLPGSPAIDGCTNGTTFTTDQRGFPRVVGPFADLGAVEFQAIPVIINADSGAGSLRYAITYVTNGATITFDPSLSGATILLTNGQLNVPNSVSILGPGPGLLTVSGNHASPVFNITGTNVTISGLTIANGQSAQNGGGINAGGPPGSTLVINNCVVTNNSATAWGGGIFNTNVTLTVSHCTLVGNSADMGAGIFNDQGALNVLNSTFSGNYSFWEGGGLYNCSFGGTATVTINSSTFSGNAASYEGGGGLYNCGYGVSATVTINASTFSSNSTDWGGGGCIFNDGRGGASVTVQIADTILNGGAAAGNIFNISGTITSAGYNLSSDNSGSSFLNQTGDQNNTDPKLGPLQNNGGPTWTHALLAGSPAIDAGADSVTNTFATDQRGYPRCSGAHVDIGAVEAQWAPANLPPLLWNSAWTAPGGARCFQCTFSSVTNADFTVLATTNLALPLRDWTMLAPAIQCSPGQYQFTDPGATNYAQRFYQVVSP